MIVGVRILCVCGYLTNIPLVMKEVSQISMDLEWSLKGMEQLRELYLWDHF